MGNAGKIKSFVIKHWPLLTLLAVWLVFAHPYFFKGLVPFPSRNLVDFFAPWNGFYGMSVKNNAMSDVITQLYPWKKITIDSWKQLQIPAWNPYQFAGYPLLANVQSAVWTPLNLLFFIFPFNDAWSFLILLQPIAAAIGMFLFVRSIGQSKLAGLLSSISFMFCGFIVVWMAYGTLVWAALSLPWILWSLTQKRWIISSLFVAFSLFSGHIQTSLYVIGASLLFSLYQRKQVTKALLGLLLGVVIAMPQLIPTIRFYDQSVRSELFGKLEVIPWNYLPTILAPDILGNPVTRNDWFGHYAEWASYAGVIPLFLSFFGLFVPRKKPKIIWYFVLLMVGAITLSYPTPILDAVVNLHIPILSTSSASRIVILLSFSIAVLGGFGLDSLTDVWHQVNKRRLLLYSMLWFCIVMFIWSMIIWGNLFWIRDVDGEKISVAERNFIIPSLLVLGTIGLVFMGLIRQGRVRRAVCIGLFLLASIDMLRFAMKWMPFEERAYVYPELPVLTYLSKEHGFERVFGNFGNEGQSVFGLYGIEGYDPLYVRRYGQFISGAGDGKVGNLTRTTVLIGKQGIYTKRMLDLLSVKLILHARGDGRNIWAFPYWNYSDIAVSPSYSDEQYEVYRNEGALPRAYFVPSFMTGSNDQELLDLLFSESTDLHHTVILEETPEEFVSAGNGQELFERVRITRFTPNEINIDVETNTSGLLVLTDPYYPGWSAYVNGKSTKIYRANFALRAIVVPMGVTQVRFRYDHWFL
ncbi:MAG: hypothetical protein UU34_C0006G0041 [Candidatus Curtissbacteria bacterium GW2011_GWA1_41_11]|uniref:YfhO family protein n=1 Tax=Candidatus Curtissbacteria bacterium GW2011_GWA1_41_11 TaxID=1618409 RepID=A0A0G0XHS3_9BACT|nr:MAG: hypothetical protein UU34_C0006G0041 [Candidatus Curtissbacteria bacterium GW2011_GWA1_41_11]